VALLLDCRNAAAGGATIWQRTLRRKAADTAALSVWCVVTDCPALSAAGPVTPAAGGATTWQRILRHKAPDTAALLVFFRVDVLSMTAVRCLLTVLCALAAGGATMWERILRHKAPETTVLSVFCVVPDQ
jgi:hypothetical protein